jgi:hypothetical protein
VVQEEKYQGKKKPVMKQRQRQREWGGGVRNNSNNNVLSCVLLHTRQCPLNTILVMYSFSTSTSPSAAFIAYIIHIYVSIILFALLGQLRSFKV